MTKENNEAIDDVPQNDDVVADNESLETQEDDVEQDVQETEDLDNDSDGDEVEFPKKAVNALNRKNKKINKLNGRIRELEAKLNEKPQVDNQPSDINPDDFETYGDYLNAQVEARVDERIKQSQSDMQRQQLTAQQEQLKRERDQYIIDQAQEAAQTFTDLPQVWQQNAQLLDSLPKEIEEIFYSIENAPAAVYTLAKEGKLESLLYANPAVAAYEIVNAQNKGMELLSRPKQRVSQAPEPISKAKGSGSVKKQLSPSDDVLKSLGLK